MDLDPIRQALGEEGQKALAEHFAVCPRCGTHRCDGHEQEEEIAELKRTCESISKGLDAACYARNAAQSEARENLRLYQLAIIEVDRARGEAGRLRVRAEAAEARVAELEGKA